MKIFRSSDTSSPLRLYGVSCDVQSCIYHDGDHFCTANRIRVGPGYATARTDTVCGTYHPREQRRSQK